jgi:hypothetical protein
LPDTAWDDFRTQWENVDRLADQARQAWRHGLDVAAAVTARVTVEVAIETALRALDNTESWERMRAWERDDLLFDKHPHRRHGQRFQAGGSRGDEVGALRDS